MIREYIGIGVLIALFVLLMINVGVMEGEAQSLYDKIDAAQILAAEGKIAEAAQTTADANQEWLSWSAHSHILLRHDEVEEVTHGFFELIKCLESHDGATDADFDYLRESIRCLIESERLTFEAVF